MSEISALTTNKNLNYRNGVSASAGKEDGMMCKKVKLGAPALAVAVMVSAMLLLVGCGGDDNPGSNNGGNGGHTHTWGDWVVTTPATCGAPGLETRTCTQDAGHVETKALAQLTGAQCETTGGTNIILGANRAWVRCGPDCSGIIFESNNEYVQIRALPTTIGPGSTWVGSVSGTWSISGNNLTLTSTSGTVTSNTFNVSGNNFTFGSAAYTNQAITTWRDRDVPANWLVNSPGEAWIGQLGNLRLGFILHADGTYTGVRRNDVLNIWESNGAGTWTVNGDRLNLEGTGEETFRGNRTYVLSSTAVILTFGTTVLNRWESVVVHQY